MRKIYAIRDRIAEDLAGMFPLVVMRTDQQAVRYFGDSLVTTNTALAAHPDDYELIEVGLLQDDGTITAFEPKIIITGTALLAATEENKNDTIQLTG